MIQKFKYLNCVGGCMVRPYEEEQAERLNDRQLKTLFTIFSRYFTETYKQFKWKVDIGMADIGIFSNDAQSRRGENLRVEVRYDARGKVLEAIINKRIQQTFPVTGGETPRELGQLARNIFKWVKGEMDKI